jgi:hypothetical protein
MKRKWLWIGGALLATAGVGSWACANRGVFTAHAQGVAELTIAQVESDLADAKAGKVKLAVYDANSQARYEQSHLPTARWVDHSAITANDLPADKDTKLLFYCANEH